jgi:hypothetical protein
LIDIDEWRDKQIQLHGLVGTDVEATFYYDETNNIRKLYIGDQGLNVAELKVFVLGGVLRKGKPRSIDLHPLRETMRIQRSPRDHSWKFCARRNSRSSYGGFWGAT